MRVPSCRWPALTDNALTFTQDNWHAPQTVSVSADAEAQSSTITIEHSVASADDPDYASTDGGRPETVIQIGAESTTSGPGARGPRGTPTPWC